MNGATADPCATTMSMPRSAMTTKMGHSQYLLRIRKKAHNSLSISIPQLLELVRHRIRRRSGRFPRNPVRTRVTVALQAQWIFAGKTHQGSNGSHHAIEYNGECDRTDYLSKQK